MPRQWHVHFGMGCEGGEAVIDSYQYDVKTLYRFLSTCLVAEMILASISVK